MRRPRDKSFWHFEAHDDGDDDEDVRDNDDDDDDGDDDIGENCFSFGLMTKWHRAWHPRPQKRDEITRLELQRYTQVVST